MFKGIKIKFGRFYIIAPENAGSGAIPNGFEEIWQYGCNENRDPAFLQDGVAPQTIAKDLPPTNRIYIPNDGNVPMGFVESHRIANYGWIFQKTVNDPGYVKTRK